MKQLRILTGRHAGVQLTLQRPSYLVGDDDDADIHISDWNHPPVRLVVTEHEEGPVQLTIEHPPIAGAAAAAMNAFADFAPRRFADVVLCVGPDKAPWPSDVALLLRLIHDDAATSAPAVAPSRRLSRRLLAGSGLAAVLLLGGFTVVVSRSAAPAVPLATRVADTLARAKVGGLAVNAAGAQVVVQGLLPGATDVARVRSLLEPFGEGVVIHRYAAASDLQRAIGDALATGANLEVTYRGGGVFAIDGSAPNIERVRGDARRVTTDLAPLVTRIDVNATEALQQSNVHVGAVLAGGDLQYVQTADGTKHMAIAPDSDAIDAVPRNDAPLDPPKSDTPLVLPLSGSTTGTPAAALARGSGDASIPSFSRRP